MKKLNLWLLLSLFVASFALCACSSSDDSTSGGGGAPQPSYNGNPDNPRYAALYGVVVNDNGLGLSGVKVTAGSNTMTTSIGGSFTFNQVSGKVLVFEKEGYAKVVRPISADITQYDVVMTEAQTQDVSTTSPTTLDLEWNGTKVTLPTTFKDKNGNAYTGSVKASTVYLDPDNDDFAKQMPGDLSAVASNGDEKQLVSYGMVNVELTGANGEELQPDGDATLKFSIPEKFASNPPSEIPLWEFDEATGVWKEEGVAILQGGYYVGTVTHFSWHNLDMPEARATLKVKVQDSNGTALKNLLVDFDGQRSVYTDKDGVAVCTVPSNTNMVISIPSEAYGDYAANEYGSVDKSKLVKQTVSLNPQESKTITLKMPSKAPRIKGCVANSGSGSNVCQIWISYGYGNTTPRVVSDMDGAYTIYGPANYRGDAKLMALFGDGSVAEQSITITDDDQTVNFAVDNNAAAGAAIIKVTDSNGLNKQYIFPAPKNGSVYENAVTFSEGTMTVSINTMDQMDSKEEAHREGWGDINLQIPNYDATKTSFTASSFNMFLEGQRFVQVGADNVPITVTKNGDVYNFKISGAKGTLMDRDMGFEWDNKATVNISAEFAAK